MSNGTPERLVQVEIANYFAKPLILDIQAVAAERNRRRYVTAGDPKVSIDDENALPRSIQDTLKDLVGRCGRSRTDSFFHHYHLLPTKR